MWQAIEQKVREFKAQCRDERVCLEFDEVCRLKVGGQRYVLSETARRQVCQTVGCNVRFLSVLEHKGLGEVLNEVVPERVYLVRLRGDKVRAVLSRYTPIDYDEVVESLLKKVNFVKVLASDVVASLQLLTDDWMWVKVAGSGELEVSVVDSETGVGAVSAYIVHAPTQFAVKVLSHPHLAKLPEQAERVLAQSVVSVAAGLDVLKANCQRQFKMRWIDRKLLPYQYTISAQVLGKRWDELKRERLVQMRIEEFRVPDTSDLRVRMSVACALYALAMQPDRYIKDGWLCDWPSVRS